MTTNKTLINFKVLEPEKEGQNYYIAPAQGGRCFKMASKADAYDILGLINNKTNKRG